MALCSDDKSKIYVAKPDVPALTEVRGFESITPKLVNLEALDHEKHKSFLTPNVALRFDIPASTDKSFVRGNVYYTVSGSIFYCRSAFRHGVMLCKITKGLEHIPPILMRYTDGGIDQRNTLEFCPSM